MTTGREAGKTASRKGQQIWDRDAGGTHLMLPVGCAAHALPHVGEVEKFAILERALCPRQLPANQQTCSCCPTSRDSSWSWLARATVGV